MVTDDATKAFLAALREAGGPPLWQQTVQQVRAAVATASGQLAVAPADVHEVGDRKIPVAGGRIGIRVYTPRSARGPLPLLLHYHGAGFVAGDLDTHDAIARYYCKHADVIVVSVDYRLAPEHPFPTGVEDCFAALNWAVEHAEELGGDITRVGVTGDSAGGNLSAVMCQLAKARGGPKIAFQALVYPVVDLDASADYPSRSQFGGGDYFLSSRDMEWFRSLYLTDVAQQMHDPRVSPLRADDLTGLPQAVVVTAGCDLLRDEGKAYADRLAKAGVPVEYRCFETTIHACMSFALAIPAGQQMLNFIASRLRLSLQRA